MSQYTLKFLRQSLTLSLGSLIFLGSSAIASPSQPKAPLQLSQAASEEPDVIIETEADTTPRFTCEVVNGQYTVMYRPENQPEAAYPWAIPSAMGGGWTPEKRCAVISQRLESYRPDGLLTMSTSVENNYDIVCVTTEANASCRIVFTVPPGQDPTSTRDRVFENLTIADSGQSTQGVNTFSEGEPSIDLVNQVGQILNGDLSTLGNLGNLGNLGSRANGIDLRPFLAPQDGGTGTALRGRWNAPSRTENRRLNPDLFR